MVVDLATWSKFDLGFFDVLASNPITIDDLFDQNRLKSRRLRASAINFFDPNLV